MRYHTIPCPTYIAIKMKVSICKSCLLSTQNLPQLLYLLLEYPQAFALSVRPWMWTLHTMVLNTQKYCLLGIVFILMIPWHSHHSCFKSPVSSWKRVLCMQRPVVILKRCGWPFMHISCMFADKMQGYTILYIIPFIQFLNFECLFKHRCFNASYECM